MAPILAMSIVAICGTVGLSVDGARVYGARAKLQAVADAAVLAAARRAMADGGSDNITAAFDAYLAASGVTTELNLRQAAPNLSTPRRISTEIVADVPTMMMQLLGFEKIEVRAFASAEFGMSRLEVALALDNTGSMLGAKMDALRASARRLADQLLDGAPEVDAVRLALVPFAQYVNVGTENRHASWMDVRDDYSEELEWCGYVEPVISQTNCRTVTYTYYMDGRPMTGTYVQCDEVRGPAVYQCFPYTATYTWNGCAGSRSYPLNMQDENYSTRIPGILNATCPSRILPLTSSRSEIHAAIDGMVATGSTYVPSGVMWGLRTLSPREPFSESGGDRLDADGNRISKVLILMTDGANTMSPTYPDHEGRDTERSNALTLEACSVAKAARIQVFTIAFDVNETAIKDLMRSCASTPGNFYDAANAGQLDAAMQAIGSQLGGLRLTN